MLRELIFLFFLGENYPYWPCGDFIIKYSEEPKDWLQSGWAFDCIESKRNPTYNAKFNNKKCLGMIECAKCEAQVRPIIKGHGKKIDEQLIKGCPLSTCNGILILFIFINNTNNS